MINQAMNSLFEDPKQLLFNLDPFFAANEMNLLDKRYFPNNSSKSVVKSPVVKYKPFPNPYIENEVKGFIQHIVIDLHYSSSTIKGYFDFFIHPFIRFITNFYPKCTSITEYDYESIYFYYSEHLKSKNIKTVKQRGSIQVNASMEWVEFPAKTQYISSFSKYALFIRDFRYPDTTPEYEKMVWDIRKLGIPYSIAEFRPRYTINFGRISQQWLLKSAKKYICYRVRNRSMASIQDDLKAINLFSYFLSTVEVQLESMEDITRNIIEDYFAYVRSQGFVTTVYNRRISAIKTFFSIGNMLCLEGFPSKQLIINSDFDKVVHKLPKYFSDNEMKRINDHIAELPLQIGRMLFILENCGMRLSDICSSPILVDEKPCITYLDSDRAIFTYYMPKTKRTNSIPVSGLVSTVIEEATEGRKRLFGSDCTHIFAKSKNKPISIETFVLHLNRMSKINELRKDNGERLRIQGHTFRGTVATQYANNGIGLDVIRMMLGQQKIGVLKHYITIHSVTMVEYMREITEENNKLINSIGNTDLVESAIKDVSNSLPLPNGRCSKDPVLGICKHANACYSCRMFHPSIQFLDLYESQLSEVENNIAIAEMQGYERILEYNGELKKQLTTIIDSVKKF